jgi:hypothetical protein
MAEFIGQLIAGARTVELADRQNTLEAAAEVVYPWGTEPYRQSAVTLANEPDRARRRTMAGARRPVVEQLTPIARDMIARHHATARELGFDGYTTAIEQIGRLDLGALHDATQTFLRETESLYEREMSAVVAERLGQSLDETDKCDVGYLWRAPEFDPMFPKQELVGTVERAVRRLGLDIYAGGNVHLDIEPRPKKSPRAFTVAIEVPGRVILVIMPAGGQNDWRAFMHELGHCLLAGYTDAALDFEFRRLGDNSVTEAFAFLFEHLLLDQAFLDEYLPHELATDFVRFAHRNLLYMLRRYCAKLDHELALHDDATTPNSAASGMAAHETAPHDGGTQADASPATATPATAAHAPATPETAGRDLAALYAGKLTRATRVAYDPADYLIDVDHGFYCARYLRAWFFEAALAARLADTFGPKWFTTREAGEFLRSLWSDGQRLRTDELEAQLGLPHTDPTPLIARLKAHLDD